MDSTKELCHISRRKVSTHTQKAL